MMTLYFSVLVMRVKEKKLTEMKHYQYQFSGLDMVHCVHYLKKALQYSAFSQIIHLSCFVYLIDFHQIS